MFKRKFLAIALEDALETEKLLEQSEEAASDSGGFSVLLNNVSAQVTNMQQQRDNPVNQNGSSGGSDYSSDDSDDSSDSDSSDDGDSGGDDFDMDMDMDMDDGGEDTEEESEEESTEEEAQESAHLWIPATEENLHKELSLYGQQVALENENNGYGQAAWEGLKSAGSALYVAGQALGYIGVNILWPNMKKLYKASIYLGGKIIRYYIKSMAKVKEVKEDYQNRTDKIRKDLETAREVVKQLEIKRDEFPDAFPEKLSKRYGNKAVINRIKIGDNYGIKAVSSSLDTFLKDWHGKISRDILKDNAAINQILHYGVEASINPVKTFGDTSMRQGLIPDNRVTHELKNGFVDALRYKAILPGDMVYCCALPNGEAETIDDIRAAYEASSCSFTMEQSSFKRIDEIDYMDLDTIKSSLDVVEGVLKTLESQIDIYDTIQKEKLGNMTKFKRYFLSLADADEKISIEKSMMEYVYLRGVYIDNVYTVTARDIHLFTQKYLANVMTYLGSNLEELSS